MSPQELLSSQRTVYVLAEKPGIDDTTAKPYWSLKLEGLHPDQLKSAVARLRTQKRKVGMPKSEERTLKSTDLLHSLARALVWCLKNRWNYFDRCWSNQLPYRRLR